MKELLNTRTIISKGILHGKIILEERSGHIELPQVDWHKGEP